ncbi:uncharacterized protein LACBIDRAFT_299842 [Laccaria bicolor S238N-H82]|uniref:Predicted protein n=1 Tax=Laccaria bicolor (strain S238N-H82 / ATCC MYA-4686) TaxID=486041 RepID=B0DFJ8_LACBS|nr:uncharacterized protein LACBIDRAFT_299842 [Laccaria bicolor S238N-H82]EDR06876.1 predicted protein [Laccaria bicolor S238N-H82]|eukprot:XP_001882723.1 predicted protein [Laccaria bicolor S238N-H82]
MSWGIITRGVLDAAAERKFAHDPAEVSGYMSVVMALAAAAQADGTTDEEEDLPFLSLHIFPLEVVDVPVAPPVWVAVAVEDAVVVALTGVEVPPFTNEATGEPWRCMVHWHRTPGNQRCQSCCLYAPGKLTNPEGSGTPVPDAPTVSRKQAG